MQKNSRHGSRRTHHLVEVGEEASMSPDARVGESVRATLARNELAESLGLIDELVATFARHGSLVDGRHAWEGRTAIRAHLERLRRRPPVAGSPSGPSEVRREITATRIRIMSPAEARATSDFVAFSKFGIDHRGRFEDVLHGAGSEWLIARRVVIVDAAVPNSAARGRVRRRPRNAVSPSRPPVWPPR